MWRKEGEEEIWNIKSVPELHRSKNIDRNMKMNEWPSPVRNGNQQIPIPFPFQRK